MSNESWDSEPEGWGMLWRFVEQSPAFVAGVEAGIIYERMSRKEQTVQATTHTDNEEELRNLANSLDYSASFEPFGDETFSTATFMRIP
jgi:hypothetical protein